MLYHPYVLAMGMVLFLAGAIEGYAVVKNRKRLEENRHGILMYSAYALFVVAMIIYYGAERQILEGIPGAKEAFRSSGYLLPHVISITLASVLLTVGVVFGFARRNVLFKQGIKRWEILHMGIGNLGLLFYVIAVLSGLGMYISAGLL